MDKLIIGCGYLGSRVAAQWHAAGHRVFATTRSEAQAEEFRRLGYEPVVCDVTNPASLKSLPLVDVAVHAIGLDRGSGQTMREVYVEGLTNVLDALPKLGRFIYVSSLSVFGQMDGELIDESSAIEPIEESGRIVREAERLLRSRMENAITLRFAGIYGPGRLLRERAIVNGEPIVGNPERWLNLIHVEDGVRAVLAAEERARPGMNCNVSDNEPVKRRDYYRLLAEVLNAPEPRFIIPEGDPPPHERTNRRAVNALMRLVLKVDLEYPTYREGLIALR